MEKKLIRTKRLLELFNERESLFQEKSKEIEQLLSNNLLDTLIDYFNVDPINVSWVAFDIYKDILMITGVFEHLPSQEPDFLNKISPVEETDDEITKIQRLVKIVIPATMCDATKEQIEQFLNEKTKTGSIDPETNEIEVYEEDTEEPTEEPTEIPINKYPNFDLSKLSKDQAESLSFFLRIEHKKDKH